MGPIDFIALQFPGNRFRGEILADMVAQLQQLSQMHEAGVLTDEEFAAAKQKVLAA